MRVALIAPEIPDYAMEYARTLRGSVDVLLLMPGQDRPLDGWIEQAGVATEWLPWPRQRRILPSIALMRRLAQRVRRWQPDVVHILMNGHIWTTALECLFRPFPVLTAVHDVTTHPGDKAVARVPNLFFNLGVRQSAAIVVHGETLRRQAMARWSLPPERCFVLPHVPLARYREIAAAAGLRRRDDGIFRILFFGRICAYKGLGHLLSAVEMLQQSGPPVKLIVAGSGALAPYRGQLARLASVAVHNEFISAPQAAALFAEADVLALPYIEASQSGVLMIAMPFALPVVASNVGEIAETVARTGTGLLVPPHDPVSLARALDRVRQDSGLRAALAANALSAMQTQYAQTTLAQQARTIYQQVRELAAPLGRWARTGHTTAEPGPSISAR